MVWPVITEEALLRFLLVLSRTAAFFSVFPVFGGGGVPVRIKAATGAVIAILIYGAIPPLHHVPSSGLEMGLLVARETLYGLMLGGLVHFVFMGAQFAGQAVGVQMGLSLAGVFDPNTRETVGVSGRFYYLLAVLLFLGLDLHHPFLAGLGESFRLLPIGDSRVAVAGLQHWAELSSSVFLIAVRMSLPVIGTLLLVDVSLGFMARLIPQMNIFLVGFPLKIGVGILALALGMTAAGKFLKASLETLLRDFHSLMSWMT
ncbi:MAG: flagellar biosynthetic protein FliR [Candidatus Krumholzibacteria bacterium]|jgi:flagellar biosynthetic protein FliR|nr:flagellar biosynthetic protein FliR [Candidatus Krumholzibacteria bacterium]MDP6669211.1 flagellar biosynthetic protein FliR [Candidatus Krumholzibacteria bacterium]MDP6797085.1 flagellar biosynthetic protein FliR [Candidatus Krumholzibacteria bacterium]MDP7020939.1 flagellar biosynthetic protein FliR [Candidatus Krumholzibacteria bacterium]